MKKQNEKPFQMLQDSLTSKEGKEDAEAFSNLMRKGMEKPDNDVDRIVQEVFDEIDQEDDNTSALGLSEN